MICPRPNTHAPNPTAVSIKEAIKETFRVFMPILIIIGYDKNPSFLPGFRSNPMICVLRRDAPSHRSKSVNPLRAANGGLESLTYVLQITSPNVVPETYPPGGQSKNTPSRGAFLTAKRARFRHSR